MTSPDSQQLEYAQHNYHYRRPAWQPLAVFSISGAVIVVLVSLTSGLGSIPWCFFAGALFVVVLTIAYSARIALLGSWECRIEGLTLTFHRPGDDGWITLLTTDIDEVIDLFTSTEQQTHYELILRGQHRALLDRRLISDFMKFKQALRAANPKIQFSRRDDRECYQCGADLRVRRDRCPSCNTPIAQPFPPAPAT